MCGLTQGKATDQTTLRPMLSDWKNSCAGIRACTRGEILSRPPSNMAMVSSADQRKWRQIRISAIACGQYFEPCGVLETRQVNFVRSACEGQPVAKQCLEAYGEHLVRQTVTVRTLLACANGSSLFTVVWPSFSPWTLTNPGALVNEPVMVIWERVTWKDGRNAGNGKTRKPEGYGKNAGNGKTRKNAGNGKTRKNALAKYGRLRARIVGSTHLPPPSVHFEQLDLEEYIYTLRFDVATWSIEVLHSNRVAATSNPP